MRRWLLAFAFGLGLGVCPGAHGFAADPDPEIWDEAWRIVDASPLPSPSDGRDGGRATAEARTYRRVDKLYRTLRKDGADAPQRLTPSVQGFFWSVLYNFTGAFTDVWHTDAPSVAAPSPSSEALYEEYDYDYEYSTWPWEVVNADPNPSPVLRGDDFDYDIDNYSYSTKLYYWNGDETP